MPIQIAGNDPMSLVLAIILALLLVGVAPVWPHSVSWGYYPSGGLGLLLVVFIIYVVIR